MRTVMVERALVLCYIRSRVQLDVRRHPQANIEWPPGRFRRIFPYQHEALSIPRPYNSCKPTPNHYKRTKTCKRAVFGKKNRTYSTWIRRFPQMQIYLEGTKTSLQNRLVRGFFLDRKVKPCIEKKRRRSNVPSRSRSLVLTQVLKPLWYFLAAYCCWHRMEIHSHTTSVDPCDYEQFGCL